MASRDSTGPKKTSRSGQPKPSRNFESSLRAYPSPLLSTRQRPVVVVNATPASSHVNTTPVKSNQTLFSKSKGFASTPVTNFAKSLACDASVIEADQSCLPLIKDSFSVRTKAKPAFMRAKTEGNITSAVKALPMTALPDESRRKEKLEEDLAQAESNILYSEYIQAAYLESRAKKSLVERDKNAVDNLHKLWSVNQILMQQEKSLCREMEAIQLTSQLVDFCKREKQVIEPLVAVLPTVMVQYKEITDAVDTLRHKLYTPGVSLGPSPDSNFEDEIVEIIKEVKHHLENLLVHLTSKENDFLEVAELLSAIKEMTSETSDKIKRCQTLLSKADSLTITETSLKIGESQFCK